MNMKRNLKKSAAAVVALTMFIVSAGFSDASERPIRTDSEKGTVVYRWTALNTVSGTLDILSGGMANPVVRGTTHAGKADYVNVAVSLKKSSGSGWSTIKSWNRDITISLNKFTFNETCRVGRNYSYRFTATVKSYKNGDLLDSVTFDSKIVSY